MIVSDDDAETTDFSSEEFSDVQQEYLEENNSNTDTDVDDDDAKGTNDAKRSRIESLDELSIKNENNVIELNNYWPHLMDVDEEVNKDLLYLFSVKTLDTFHCEKCPATKQYTELVQMIEYYEDKPAIDLLMTVETNEHPKAYHDLMVKHGKKSSFRLLLKLGFRPICCKNTAGPPRSRYENPFDWDTFPKSPLLRFFFYKNCVIVYLKVDKSSIPLIPRSLDHRISLKLEQKYFNYQLTSIGNKNIDTEPLTDTFDFPEAVIPAGFKLKLRDYQLRSITWMMQIESEESHEINTINHNYCRSDTENLINLKLGHTPYYVELNKYRKITETPETVKPAVPLRISGGILADNTGSGKTITTLGLVHAAPFTQEKEKKRKEKIPFPLKYISSRATCIICPSNIYKQWLQEAKKVNPKSNVLGLSTILDHNKISWKDMMKADILIVSYQFLQNSNYQKVVQASLSAVDELQDHFDIPGRVVLSTLIFHRLVLDEFHELESAKSYVKEYIKKSLKADHIWGLTGTPKISKLSDDLVYFNPSTRFKSVLEENSNALIEFVKKHVKRNIPDLKLPEIVNETVWVDLSPNEAVLLKWNGEKSGIKEQIMMCSHYQLNEKAQISLDSFMSIEQAQIKLTTSKKKELETFKMEEIYQQALIESLLESKPNANVSELRVELRKIQNLIKSAESNYNYFQTVFKAIGEPDSNTCLICHEIISDESLSILPCSHFYCNDCIGPALKMYNSCPLCRYKLKSMSDVFVIKIKTPPVLPQKSLNIDTSKYSSKLISLYHYITNLVETDDTARIILFLQYSDLADFIAESFAALQ